jgi:P4 family phage/plasmid primase-like protien
MSQTFTLYHSDSIGRASNCSYPHAVEVTDADTLAAAVMYDYVAVEYKNDYRNNINFIKTTCLVLDCDNDHSEDPAEWITPEQLHEALPDVAFAVHYSRNHNKMKNGKTARPKFHCFFPIPELTDSAAYSALKRQVQAIFTFFDPNALDAARFFFGTTKPEVAFFDGDLTITDYLADYAFESMEMADSTVIPEGSRNSTLSHFAGRVLKRYGNTDEAYDAFQKEAAKCDPPLEEHELKTIWRSALQFYRKVQQQDGYVAPEHYNTEFQYRPDDFTDVGQAQVLSRVSVSELRYSPATDYIVFNGTIWEESKHGAQAVAQKLTTHQLEEATAAAEKAWKTLASNGAADVLSSASSKKKAEAKFSKEQAVAYTQFSKASEYKAFALDRRSSKNITNTLKEARPMLAITPRELDSDPYLLCTPAGTYDLRKGMAGLMPHRPEDYMTKVTAVSPSDKGADLWAKQLNLLFCGDKDLIEYAQLIAGTACVGKMMIEQMIIAYGCGANGKSTFWNTLARVLGTYSGNMSSDALTTGTKRNVKPEMAELKGKRLVIAAELEEGTRMNTSTVKQLSSTDEVYAEKKYKDPFSFIPSHMLVLYTNHLPKVGAIDAGTWRRLIVMPFNARIVGKSDIKNYADYLFQNAGEAVLAWIIEGAKRVIDLDFKFPLPAVVEQATAKYREENNWLDHFLTECCEVDPSYSARSGEVYQAYRSYCNETGDYFRSTAEFYTALETEGFTRRRTRSGNLINGFRLKTREFSTVSGFDDFLK